MPAQRSLTQSPVAVRGRLDLRAVETRHKHQSAVVVKDPVAMKYHRLRNDEYFVLEQLDGTVSLDELTEREPERTRRPSLVVLEPRDVSLNLGGPVICRIPRE